MVLGDYGVGKTALINQFLEASFTEQPNLNPLGPFRPKIIDFGTNRITKVDIWDVMHGKQRPSATAFTGVAGILLLFDVTDTESFSVLEKWLILIDKYTINRESISWCVKILIVGTKIDLLHETQISKIGKKVNSSFSLQFVATSAKTSFNVENAFLNLSLLVLEDMELSNRTCKEWKRKNRNLLIQVLLDLKLSGRNSHRTSNFAVVTFGFGVQSFKSSSSPKRVTENFKYLEDVELI
jgi:GTPase SAR1 family protein